MLTVIPKDMDFDVRVTIVDHFAPERSSANLYALAVVVQDNMSEMVSMLYSSYFPQIFRIRVQDDEHEVLAWLKGQMAEVVQEGA